MNIGLLTTLQQGLAAKLRDMKRKKEEKDSRAYSSLYPIIQFLLSLKDKHHQEL